MPHDPRLIPASVEQGLADRVKALERRIAVLERARPSIYFGNVPPTVAAPRGSLYFEYGIGRLWVRAATVWRYVDTTPA